MRNASCPMASLFDFHTPHRRTQGGGTKKHSYFTCLLTNKKHLYGHSWQNHFDTLALSCYTPLTSFQRSLQDKGHGILVGVENHTCKHQLIPVGHVCGYFNSSLYATQNLLNISSLGCAGAGKTFLLQFLMTLLTHYEKKKKNTYGLLWHS